MGLFNNEQEWRQLGAAFGLQPFKPTASFWINASFRQMKRALGVPAASHAPSFDEWHYGKWNDREVLLVNYTVSEGSSQTTYTAVVARVDPPLFLGLRIGAKPVFELFPDKAPILTGYPNVDERLRIMGFDPHRVIAFLALHTPEGS